MKGLALSTDGKGRYGGLDPYLGAVHAVAEAARNVAVSGARPLAITNCLNFGNPERPEVMRQFAEAIRGMRDACLALETPVTGGNVSFYNESGDSAIDPTPVIGMLGLLRRSPAPRPERVPTRRADGLPARRDVPGAGRLGVRRGRPRCPWRTAAGRRPGEGAGARGAPGGGGRADAAAERPRLRRRRPRRDARRVRDRRAARVRGDGARRCPAPRCALQRVGRPGGRLRRPRRRAGVHRARGVPRRPDGPARRDGGPPRRDRGARRRAGRGARRRLVERDPRLLGEAV